MALKFLLMTFLRAGALARLKWKWISKKDNLLVLANHGSRIDWMIGMFNGFCGRRLRVGFVCEGLIQAGSAHAA